MLKTLPSLLKLDPYSKKDRQRYNDAAVMRKLQGNPSAATAKYSFFMNGKKVKHYPLMILCALGASKETIEAAYHACPEALQETDDVGWTPLHVACSNQSSAEVIKFLVMKAGSEAVLATSYKDLWTPIHLLCRYGATLEKIKILVEANPLSLAASTSNGSVPLHLAILHDVNITIIEYMVEANAETVMTPNIEGRTPIQYAKKKGFPRNVVRDMKRAAISAKTIERPSTRADLERVIAGLEATIKAAQEDANVDTTILDNAIGAKQQLKWLYPLREELASKEELESSIKQLTAERDSLRSSGDIYTAREVQTSIDELTRTLKIEVEAKRRMDAPKDIEHSRELLLQKLSSRKPSDAAQLSITFIEQATENFSQKNLIGKGGFGEVFRATDVASGVSFAVKKIHPNVLLGDTEGRIRENIHAEIKGLTKLWHNNIVRLLGYHISDDNSKPQCLVYELAAGGSLADLISTRDGREALTWRKRVRTAFAIVSAELYLCSQQCYHRDMKPHNICYWPNLEKVILIDYGIAEFMDSQSFQGTLTASRFAGSRPYAAPEYLNENRFGEKSEVYSIGMVLKVLITGKLAGSKHSPDGDAGDLREQTTEKMDLDQVDALAGNWDQSILESLKSLAMICTAPDRNDRPSMQQLFEELDDIETRSHRVLSAEEQTSVDSALSVSLARTGDVSDLMPLQVMQCLFCNRKSKVGLLCPSVSSAHFSCKRCFMDHVMENIGEEHIHCQVEGCCSPPYALEQIYRSVSNSMFSKHWEIQQKNKQYAYQARRDEAFADRIVKAVGSKIDESLQSTMRCLELIGQNELACPKLCLVVPTRSERGDSSILRTIRTLPEAGKVQLLLFFVCASEKVPIDTPIRLTMPKLWLKRVAFAVKATIVVLNLATTLAGSPVRLPVPGNNFKQEIRHLDELFSEFITVEQSAALQDIMLDSTKADEFPLETLNKLEQLQGQIREMSQESYREIAQVASENVEWRESMELCANKSGVLGWVLKRNADTWRNSS